MYAVSITFRRDRHDMPPATLPEPFTYYSRAKDENRARVNALRKALRAPDGSNITNVEARIVGVFHRETGADYWTSVYTAGPSCC